MTIFILNYRWVLGEKKTFERKEKKTGKEHFPSLILPGYDVDMMLYKDFNLNTHFKNRKYSESWYTRYLRSRKQWSYDVFTREYYE